MSKKAKIWSLVTAGLVITIFWGMLSMIFESVVFRARSGWDFLPWWFCDVVATFAGIVSFIFVYIQIMKKKD
jgi:hypothetical protein